MNYFNLFGAFSLFFAIVLPFIGMFITYLIIKAAVRNGILEAHRKIGK